MPPTVVFDSTFEARLKRLGVTRDAIRALCEQWRIRELSVFGSLVRTDFRPSSDVDLLFTPERDLDLGEYLDLVAELERLFGRSVDAVDQKLIVNSPNKARQREIVGVARTVYAAA